MLRLIGEQEGVRAGDLAAELGMERLAFKADVRKLKALGLTESLPSATGCRRGARPGSTAEGSASGRRQDGRGGGPSCGRCRAAT